MVASSLIIRVASSSIDSLRTLVERAFLDRPAGLRVSSYTEEYVTPLMK